MAECKGGTGLLTGGGVRLGEGKKGLLRSAAKQGAETGTGKNMPRSPVGEGQGHWGRGPEKSGCFG